MRPACLLGLLLLPPAALAVGNDASRCGGLADEPASAQVGDLDGDGTRDRFWLLGPRSKPLTARAADPWLRRRSRYQPEIPALVVERGAIPGCARFTVLQNRSFFATPIWEDLSRAPVRALKRGDPEYAEWQRTERRLHADAVLLGTEAGPEVLLYWDAGAYRVRLPKEAP